jgi:pilus assembly protein CpaF
VSNISAQQPRAAEMAKVKDYLINVVSRELESSPISSEDRREVLMRALEKAYQSTRLTLPTTLRDQLFHDILDEMLGFGALQPLIEDESVTEIMVNGPKKVFIERKGKLGKTNVTFENDAGVIRIIEKIIAHLGRRLDNDSPTVDDRLPYG